MELKLGKSIRALRLQKGITQETLADHLGVTFQAVSKWEVGTTLPDIGLLPSIAVYFGVPIDSLFALPEDARLTRIENMLGDARSLAPEEFASTEDYLTGLLAHDPDNARACYLLAYLYVKQSNALRERACGYIRRAVTLKPEAKAYQSLLVEAMGGVRGDMYATRHYGLISYFWEFVRAHPKVFHANLYLMNQLLADNRLDEADTLLGEMKERFPRHARLPFFEGDIAYAKGDHDRAVALWEKGLADPDSPEGAKHFYYAERMERTGRYEAALEGYAKDHELSSKPRFIDSPVAMAHIYELLGDFDKAIAMREEEIRVLQTEWGIISSERIDGPRREIERLKRMATHAPEPAGGHGNPPSAPPPAPCG